MTNAEVATECVEGFCQAPIGGYSAPSDASCLSGRGHRLRCTSKMRVSRLQQPTIGPM